MAREKQFTLNAGDTLIQPLGFRAHSVKIDNPSGLVVTELVTGQQIPPGRVGTVLTVDTDRAWAQAISQFGSSNIGSVAPALLTYTEQSIPQAPGNTVLDITASSYLVLGNLTPRLFVGPSSAVNAWNVQAPFGGLSAQSSIIGQTIIATRLTAFIAPMAALGASNRLVLWTLGYVLGSGGPVSLAQAACGLVNLGATGASASDINIALNYPFMPAAGDYFSLVIYSADGATFATNSLTVSGQVWLRPGS